MDFLDFELEIDTKDSAYMVSVVHSPAGEVTQDFELPLSGLELENQLLNLQNALLRSGNLRRRVLAPEVERIQGFGSMLFETLCPEEVRSLYDQSRREATNQGRGLRVKLRVLPPELAALPWEFIYDTRHQEFVALSRNTPMVRYLPSTSPLRPLHIEPPLRILAMAARPSDLTTLDVRLEEQRLQRALNTLTEQGRVKLDWLEGQTWRDLQQALYADRYHVFHFTGHGYFDEAGDEGMLLFCDQEGNSHRFDATSLARLLADHNTMRLIVLNACEGAKPGHTDVFSSTAATLVRRGIPAVIAMQYTITDAAAIQMAETFYQALAGGLPVDAAMSEARKSITFALPGSLEWGTPVLFMRAVDGQIFDIETTAEVPAVDDANKPAKALPPPAGVREDTMGRAKHGDEPAAVPEFSTSIAAHSTSATTTSRKQASRLRIALILAIAAVTLAALIGIALWRSGIIGGQAPEDDLPSYPENPIPDGVAGYYRGAGFGGISVNHLQDGIYSLESDPGSWGWTGCGMPWEDKIFGVGKTTNPTAPGLAYTLYFSPVGDRLLLKMIYFSGRDGSLDELESIRIDRHAFDDTVPGDTLAGEYPGGVSITPLKNNVYVLESDAQPWGWKGCGIAAGNRIFGIARSTHPNGRGLTYTLHMYLDEEKLKVNLIYFIDYDGRLVHLPSSIRVDPHELSR